MALIGSRRALLKRRGGAGGGRTYAEWQAEANRLASSGAKAWAAPIGPGLGAYRTTASAPTQAMYGSPWQYFMDASSSMDRCVQHALPSEAIFLEQCAAGRELFVQIQAASNYTEIEAVERNGYVSMAYNDGFSYQAIRCTKIIRWDDTLKKAFESSPWSGSPETEYVW